MHTKKWKGKGNFDHESFFQMHRNACVSTKAACQHMDYQLPNEHTRVTYILYALESNNSGLQAAMASIKGGNYIRGK